MDEGGQSGGGNSGHDGRDIGSKGRSQSNFFPGSRLRFGSVTSLLSLFPVDEPLWSQFSEESDALEHESGSCSGLGARQAVTKMEVGIVLWIRVTAVLEVVAALFLASLRFCVHYCIDRDTCSKKNNHLHDFFFGTVH